MSKSRTKPVQGDDTAKKSTDAEMAMADSTTPTPTAPAPTPKKKRVVGRPFTGADDPRRWKGGPKKTFSSLRHLAQEIANEELAPGVTRGEALLRKWAESDNPILAREFVAIAYGRTPDAVADDDDKLTSVLESIPADLIASAFLDVYRDIKAGKHSEYVLYGGRGSTKSSFVSLVIIWLIINNPLVHGLVLRQVGNTLRDSVFAQLIWAINALGVEDKFKSTTTPLEIEYLPTGQKIYFRGADDPGKLKSIKPKFGAISILWFEEFDTFKGADGVRKIEQSAMRGGTRSWTFKTFNPPRTMASFANQYILVPKATQYQHKSDYLSVPADWLGDPWLAEAEHLKTANPEAYNHEYLGIANFAGGMVFNNVQIRPIPDTEIETFAENLNGIDWGFYPDPAHFGRCYYDAKKMILYIFGEVRKWKASNENFYKAIKEEGGYEDWELVIADSAEPKSVADFRSYGAMARPAEKGKESIRYSMKWLQSLTAIVIDPIRCPATAKEFVEYEYERTKDDEIISAYPDANNHSIDAIRYATNRIWKRRGE